MTMETPVETITESLGSLLLSLRQRQAIHLSVVRSHQPSPILHQPCPPGRIDMLGNGQMLLPGIAEPRLWSFNSTL